MKADRLVQLFIAVVMLSIVGSSAGAQLSFPSMSDLSSFGFPSSLMDSSSAYGMPSLTELSSIPFTSSDPSSTFTSIAMQQLASPMSGLTSLTSGTGNMFGDQASAGSLFGFPSMSGFGSLSGSDSMSQIPLSNMGFSDPVFSKMQSSLKDSGYTPSSVDSYTEANSGQTIRIKLGDTIHVQLTSRLDQGYLWNISTTDGLNITANRMYTPEDAGTNFFTGVIGIQATGQWDIKAIKPGTQQVNAVCTRSEGAKAGDKTFVLTVIVE